MVSKQKLDPPMEEVGLEQSNVGTIVQTQIKSDVVFLSSSMNSEALLWDTRKSIPALGLWKKLM